MMPKRKANRKKETQVEGRRVAELPDPSMNSVEDACMVRGQKRKLSDDDEGSSRPAKKMKLFHHVHNDEEPASSSVETSKVSSSKILEGCSDEKEKVCTRNGKRKATDDGKVSPTDKKKRLDQEQPKGGTKNSVAEQRHPKSMMPKRKANRKKETQVKRSRVTELPIPSENSKEDACMVRGQKRKLSDDDEGSSRPAKKMKLFHHVHKDEEPASSSVETSKESSTDEKEKVCKRKATGDGKVSPTQKLKSLDQGQPKRSTKKLVAAERREFNIKYVQQHQLGVGGCGTVFAGYRREDKFPVAIKHIPKNNVSCKVKDENGKCISVEVAAMLKLGAGTPGSGGTSAAVSLLDWFDLHTKLILVMERPVPAVDFKEYIKQNGGTLTEETAKVILKQLIEAAKELEDKNIFHRDIKIENILIETGSDVPRVRLIDFGLSCFFTKRSWYRIFYGTPAYCPPEWLDGQSYRPGPTTVWQLGVVLYETLHAGALFDTLFFLWEILEISEELSESCQDFLKTCLDLDPKRRPILEDLLLHRWFR